MVFTYAHGLILAAAAASMLGVSMGSKDWASSNNTSWGWGWGWGSNNHPMNETTQGPNKIDP